MHGKCRVQNKFYREKNKKINEKGVRRHTYQNKLNAQPHIYKLNHK